MIKSPTITLLVAPIPLIEPNFILLSSHTFFMVWITSSPLSILTIHLFPNFLNFLFYPPVFLLIYQSANLPIPQFVGQASRLSHLSIKLVVSE